MPPFTMKSRSLPSDLPLGDLTPLKDYIGTSGGYWKIYRANLITSQAEVSVFLFDKAAINKLKQKKKIIESVWRHVEMIQNIQKYSSVTLKIILTAKENRKYIAYATEPVLGSLANVMGEYPNDISRTHAALLNKMSLCEMEIKYGVVALAETLSYLHLFEGRIHCDVSPRNIIVCTNGSWRLSGFHFVMRTEVTHALELSNQPSLVTSNFLQPDINFVAPCLFLGAPTQESDIFSLGMLITYIYNNGISLIEGTAVISEICKTTAKEIDELYDERISSAYNAIKSRVPAALQNGLSKIISFDIDARPTAQQLLMLGYYNDPLIKYLKHLNLYENLPEAERRVVLSTELPECAKNLPQTMLLSHVVPVLTLELEAPNRCAGVVHTLVICLSRHLTHSNTDIVCNLMNKILDIDMGVQLSVEAHEMLMNHVYLIHALSGQISLLNSPTPVVLLGLSEAGKLPSTLSAINNLVQHKDNVNIFTPKVVEEVKRCFQSYWSQDCKELCVGYLDSILRWLSLLGVQSLSEDFCQWFVTLISKDLDILVIMKDVLMRMLGDRDTYKLTEDFIKKKLSLSIENLVTVSNITHQRQTLVQLARYTESVVSVDVVEQPTMKNDESASSRRRPVVRQAGISVTPPALQTPPNSPQQLQNQLSFQLVVTKADEHNDKARPAKLGLQRMAAVSSEQRDSMDSASTQRRKLFRMDLSPSRAHNRSFGELMADIDDRSSALMSAGRSPLLGIVNRTNSLHAPYKLEVDSDQQRRASLQSEHYQSLNGESPDKVVSPSATPQMVVEESETPKIDSGLMKSILQRLDSLTNHFNSKSGSSLNDDR